MTNFAFIAKPFHYLTKKGTNFVWSDQCQASLDNLREELSTTPVLAHPDFKEIFILDTDASQYAICAELSQIKDVNERPINCLYQQKPFQIGKEVLCHPQRIFGCCTLIKYFRHYQFGRQFTVRTDHSALEWLINFKDPEGQLARWMDFSNVK